MADLPAEFDASRMVEAVAPGVDLSGALGTGPITIPAGFAVTAGLLNWGLAQRTVAGCRADLKGDEWAWILAASGRSEHPDSGYLSSADGGAGLTALA